MGKARILFVFSGSSITGLSSPGFHRIRSLFERDGGVVCQVLPEDEVDPAAAIRGSFRVIAFSIPYEPDYLKVVRFLRRSGIEPSRRKRRVKDGEVLIAGGIAPSLNPLPLSEIFDLIFIGEGEGAFPSLPYAIRRFLSGRTIDRDGFYSFLQEKDGFFIPEVFQKKRSMVKRVYLDDLQDHEPASTYWGSERSIFHGAPLIEVGRGCRFGCRFCATGFFSNPPRFYSMQSIIHVFERMKPAPQRVGLVGSDIMGHPEIEDLILDFKRRGVKITVSSINISELDRIGIFEKAGIRSITIAPEVPPTDSMRFINKIYDERDFIEKVESMGRIILNLKLYFIFGFPGEGDIVEPLCNFILRTRDAFLRGSKKKGRAGRISVSINPFIPKPWTPFQWYPLIEEGEFYEKRDKILKRLSGIPNLRLNILPYREAVIETFIARGDEGVGIELSSLEEKENLSHFLDRVKKGRRMEELGPFDVSKTLPWDVVDSGLDKRYLYQEFERASRFLSSPICDTGNYCSRCGIVCKGQKR